MPLTVLILVLLLFCYVRHERFKSLQRCAVFPYIAARILLVFTVFMLLVVAVSITSRHTLGGPLLAAVQSRASLYVSLFSLIVLWLMYPRMWSTTFCRECMLIRGLPQERSVLGHVYDRENGYLVRRMQAKLWQALYFKVDYEKEYLPQLEETLVWLGAELQKLTDYQQRRNTYRKK